MVPISMGCPIAMTDGPDPRSLSLQAILTAALLLAALVGAAATMMAMAVGSDAGTLAGLLVAVAGVGLIGWLLRRMIVAPLQAIAAAARSVDGGTASRAPRARITEIDAIATHCNALLVTIAAEQQQLSGVHQALLHRANFDALSGLPNRASFVEAVGNMIRQAQRSESRFAILFMDGDRFKQTNDRFGHAAGDKVIAEVAARLSPLLRVGDVAARLGGDEFAVLIRHIETLDDIDAVTGRITAAMTRPVALPGGDQITVSLSIGSAIFPDHASAVEPLIAHADAAMYAAKSAKKTLR